MLMRKFTLMLVAALIAVTSWAVVPTRNAKGHPLQKSTAVQQLRTPLKPSIKGVKVPVTNTLLTAARHAAPKARKAQRKVSPMDLVVSQYGDKMMLLSDCYTISNTGEPVASEPAAIGTPVTFEKVDDETIAISNFISGATEKILVKGGVATAEQMAQGIVATFTIEDQQLLLESDYGPILLTNVGVEESAPLEGYALAEGVIVIDGYWQAIIGGDGQYAGSGWTDICTSVAVPSNATMEWGEGDAKQTVNVFVMQDEEDVKNALVYNFGDMETAVTVNMKEDKTFVIPDQFIASYSQDYGDIHVTGFTVSAQGISVSTLTGKGSETALVFDGQWGFRLTAGYLLGDVNDPATITLTEGEFLYPSIPDVAAQPADPEILEVGPYDAADGYGYVLLDVPCTDVDGNDLKESKLFYQLYADIDGDVQPITFTPDLYKNLTEELSVIPYTFNDSYDFDVYEGSKLIFINYDFSNYDRIGVKSIYTGGGEENETEIQWMELESTEIPSAQWVAAEQGYTDAEEITSITIGEGVTGTLDKAEGSYVPKYYNRGTALRMYAGNTLTITAEKPMVKIVFTMTGTEAQMSLEADKGEYSLEGTTGTWTGEADEVVFTVPNVSGNQARIQMIEIFFAGSEGPKPVEVPEDLVVESYFFQGFDTYYEENIESQVEVGFYGENEVYFHNLSGYVDDNWVKGTIEGNVVTIPTTYLGVYQSFFGDMDLSFNGATFIYDAQTGTFTAEEGFTTSADGYDGLFMDEYTNVVLSKIIEKEATPADPEVASFKLYNEPKEGDTELTLATYPSVKFNIPMKDVEGNAMLQEKMSYIIYIVDGEGIQKELTLTTDLYEELTENLTEIPYTFTDDYDIAPGGSTVYLNQNPEEIATWKKIGVKSIYRGMDIEHSSAIAWYSIEDYIADLNKLITTAITSVNAANKQNARYYDLQGRSVEQGQKGLLIMQYTDGQGNVKTAKVVRK